jgi:hypothetical protein
MYVDDVESIRAPRYLGKKTTRGVLDVTPQVLLRVSTPGLPPFFLPFIT